MEQTQESLDNLNKQRLKSYIRDNIRYMLDSTECTDEQQVYTGIRNVLLGPLLLQNFIQDFDLEVKTAGGVGDFWSVHYLLDTSYGEVEGLYEFRKRGN